MEQAPRFPLPLGHVFSPSRLHVNHHDGKSRTDSMHLRSWQTAFRIKWRRPWMTPSGAYDGQTQRAVLEVQLRLGQALTGVLGAVEWRAVWESAPPPPKPREPKAPKPELNDYQHKQRRRKIRAYWERYSKWNIGTTPDAPEWFPGRPFGPHERGDHVRKVQSILGFADTGKFSVTMSRRITGLQRVHGLVESGLVCAETAKLIDSMSK